MLISDRLNRLIEQTKPIPIQLTKDELEKAANESPIRGHTRVFENNDDNLIITYNVEKDLGHSGHYTYKLVGPFELQWVFGYLDNQHLIYKCELNYNNVSNKNFDDNQDMLDFFISRLLIRSSKKITSPEKIFQIELPVNNSLISYFCLEQDLHEILSSTLELVSN